MACTSRRIIKRQQKAMRVTLMAFCMSSMTDNDLSLINGTGLRSENGKLSAAVRRSFPEVRSSKF